MTLNIFAENCLRDSGMKPRHALRNFMEQLGEENSWCCQLLLFDRMEFQALSLRYLAAAAAIMNSPQGERPDKDEIPEKGQINCSGREIPEQSGESGQRHASGDGQTASSALDKETEAEDKVHIPENGQCSNSLASVHVRDHARRLPNKARTADDLIASGFDKIVCRLSDGLDLYEMSYGELINRRGKGREDQFMFEWVTYHVQCHDHAMKVRDLVSEEFVREGMAMRDRFLRQIELGTQVTAYVYISSMKGLEAPRVAAE